MNERLMQFRIGVMVLASLISAATLMVLFGGPISLVHRPYTIYIRFPDAPGVTRDTPIRKSGIRIGRVSEVRFTDNDTAVLVTAEIDGKYQIYNDEVCQSVSSLLTGDAALEFARVPNFKGPRVAVQPGETLQGGVAQDPTRAIANLQENLTHTIGSVDAASKDMGKVLGRVDRLLAANEERITKVIAQMDETLKVMKDTLTNANGILGDPQVRVQFKQTMEQLPEVLAETRQAIDHLGRGLSSMETNMRNVEGLTKPLGDNGATLVRRLDTSTEKLDRLMDQMLRFTESLNNPQGSIGQLLHDRELYQRLNRSVKNIEDVTREVKPLVEDARVFADKIARHPEMLGVRGAIQKSPGTK
jgi:phospholipid/cholesterol/gamma-HCH transport system substrate-binding protein